MKKTSVLLAIFPAMLAVLGCDLIPRAVEIRVAPEIEVPIKIDLTKEIKKELKGALEGKLQFNNNDPPKIAFANNTVKGNMVVAARLNVINVTKNNLFNSVNEVSVPYSSYGTKKISEWLNQYGGYQPLSAANVQQVLDTSDAVLREVLNQPVPDMDELPDAVPKNDPINLPEGSMGDILNGFGFTDASSGELYIYEDAASQNVFSLLEYKYGVNSDTLQVGGVNKVPDEYQSFTWNDEAAVFSYYEPQKKGEYVPTLFKNNKVDAKFAVSLKSKTPKTTIRELLECLKSAGDIKVEMIAWIPLELKAGDGASFNIPVDNFFKEGEDLFKREKDKDEGLKITVVNMSIELSFSVDAFNKVFTSTEVRITNVNNPSFTMPKYPIDKDSMLIKFTDADMVEINKEANNPFTPSIEVLFKKDALLLIPYELKTAKIKINAKAVARLDF
jgi:hypothetical protein